MYLTDEKISKFLGKCQNIIDKNFTVETDDMGLDSGVKVVEENRIYSLIYSSDREYLMRKMSTIIGDLLMFSNEESRQIAEFYVNGKYNVYTTQVTNL
jgi:hypothetical protein